MRLPRRFRIVVELLLIVCVLFALGVGIALGIALASTRNVEMTRNLGETQLSLPSQILDRNGELITEYFSEEKRDIVAVDELPKHLIYALVAAEDKNFFRHNGFDLLGMIRAAWNNLRGSYFSGASSITQQIAGELYADRSDITIRRKLVELWYAFQMERKMTKYQILELYINTIYTGHNTHGFEAASQFYFGHSAKGITLAESAILVVQVRSPARFSMINHPNEARSRQQDVLNKMVELGYVTGEEARESFDSYWENYDETRSNTTTAYFSNLSRAPYFSEFVRIELEDLLYGSLVDINREGFVIHTTLDLEIQNAAEEIMGRGIRKINTNYQAGTDKRIEEADSLFLASVQALSLVFDMKQLRITEHRIERDAADFFTNGINPTLDLLSLVFDTRSIGNIVYRAYDQEDRMREKTTVEGALITLENETGHILAMIGGSEFKTKKYNRAVYATVQPGSSFKPLFYSAAISSRKFTPATMLYDSPVIFYNADGTKYMPLNYLGSWDGSVLLRTALANSMNVPSTKVLDVIGFDVAIERASRLLGMYDQRNNEELFPRKYPLALGVVAVAPINMARAFATFPNQGQEVEPLAIRYIEDRKGNILLEHEKNLIKERQRRSDEELQILSPQEAYIMVSLLESVVERGTLANRRRQFGGFDGMAMAGKTGTTDNWTNAWTVGFSPYMTSAVWFGFDLPGESLGRNQTGATAAGPVWTEYMKRIHEDLPPTQFVKPDTGLISRKVCAVSGLLPTSECDDGFIDEIFLSGTEPERLCDIHPAKVTREEELANRLKERLMLENYTASDLPMPELAEPSFDLTAQKVEGPTQNPQNGQSSNPLLD